MRIANYLNIAPQEVELRRQDVWPGISLGNRYFAADHFEKKIRWAQAYTKERVLVVIGDSLQALNIEVLDSRTPHHASRRARSLATNVRSWSRARWPHCHRPSGHSSPWFASTTSPEPGTTGTI